MTKPREQDTSNATRIKKIGIDLIPQVAFRHEYYGEHTQVKHKTYKHINADLVYNISICMLLRAYLQGFAFGVAGICGAEIIKYITKIDGPNNK
jgi:hypothetical protein